MSSFGWPIFNLAGPGKKIAAQLEIYGLWKLWIPSLSIASNGYASWLLDMNREGLLLLEIVSEIHMDNGLDAVKC
ncbi:unnamed protein product [Eruca vesicaria subsp. sativa]|uniref:Uncharacterized protein n=1 Tax=Eruca vesicaria subsp. sativa TaxID=29727 RepID=A0ABC8J960_ERUVS|nr:unnamed protein product [Eruca vesicaria subsp. sativa]